MLFKKIPKRQEPAPATEAKAHFTKAVKPANGAETSMRERRCFPRPMPVPEVHEQDWATWEDLTKEKTSQ